MSKESKLIRFILVIFIRLRVFRFEMSRVLGQKWVGGVRWFACSIEDKNK